MARTILDSFKILKSNLEITGLQESTVSIRQTNVREAIETNLSVLETFLSGSYKRQTLIAPLSKADIDIFVVLDAKYFHNYNGQNGGPGGLLDLLKRTLQKTYPRTPDISRNGQAVTIQFTDFMVDVVPSFYRQGGGFLIPNSITQSWISTDPKKHVELLTASNTRNNGNLIPLVKMIKGWNRNINSYFRSFHLEVIALNVLQNVTISDFPSGMRYYFDKGKIYVQQKNPDPAGYHDDVGDYINSKDKLEAAVSHFDTALTRALKAEDFANNNRIEEAIIEWKKIFGDYFPSYG